MLKPVTVIAVALAPFFLLSTWPTLLVAACAGVWALATAVLWAVSEGCDNPRRQASLQRFGHERAEWEAIWAHDNEKQRKQDSMLRFGHENATSEQCRQFDDNRRRCRESQWRFGHENASWDDIKFDDRRREASQSCFGHPDASVEEINEHRRKKMSQKRFGHPNASLAEIRAHDRKHRRAESSFGTGIDGSSGLKIGDGLILDPATGQITVRRS
ncbi:MAG: hypothetical protein K2W95_11110 [Candidatus Obscuribacterales bacterium]|nr:hypothetical protein [Candidatus Obscuribacterales bacterium]